MYETEGCRPNDRVPVILDLGDGGKGLVQVMWVISLV